MKKKFFAFTLVLTLVLAMIPMSVAFANGYTTTVTGQGNLKLSIHAQSNDAPPEMGPVTGYTWKVKNSAGQVVASGSYPYSYVTGSLNNLPYDTYTLIVTPNAWTVIDFLYAYF